ncbi:MAG: NADP-dependent oxidoreductase [Candidatus Acidiferrales bacterium]
MKAIRMQTRGGPGQLVYEESPKPVLQFGDALVRVHACALTPTELTWDETYTTSTGASRLPTIPGHEFSGVVEDLPAEEPELKTGDAVYALSDFFRDGAAADYIAIRAADLARKPKNLTHTQAAAVPLSALTAWQAFFDHAHLASGQRVLIHGAAGGVGTYAVQLAHWRGAHVIATARPQNAAFLRDLGADEVLDYTTVRFEDHVRDLDVVLDSIGGDTLDRSWRVLRRGGMLINLVGGESLEKAAEFGVRAIFFIVVPSRAQLTEIARLVESGILRPIVDTTFPLADARQAFEHALQRHNRGKIVLEVAEQSAAAHT